MKFGLVLESATLSHSSRLPSNSSNPRSKLLDILSLEQQFHVVVVFRQLLVRCTLMYEAVTSSARPADFVEFPFFVPSPFDSLAMDLPWDQMMICQREVFTATNLATWRP